MSDQWQPVSFFAIQDQSTGLFAGSDFYGPFQSLRPFNWFDTVEEAQKFFDFLKVREVFTFCSPRRDWRVVKVTLNSDVVEYNIVETVG